ncbi:GLPGLI family protein [Tenacibaculum aquimarinum]|uniref:GLPGLI family protein n=1 Tax=Tenacibaculum aquimarinum TaxID=2910675 RepID=UPI001F0B2770|nr:GLPGLI family protein [Tenacibaculum aquimarinum]MCH3881582.1 GLPGLI family protein [Tenacibaculum aquimarinum]
MKIFIPFFITLFFFSNSKNAFSQKYKSLKITYNIDYRSKLDSSKTKSYKKEISKLNSLIIKSSKDISYQLTIENQQSLFIVNESKMSESKNDLKKIATIITGTNGRFYVNREKEIYLHEKDFLSDLFLVKIEVKKWKITDDFKVINNFKCYKAISEDIVSNPAGIFKKKVTAWFSPDLPSFFGPAGYFGLPGLILELDNSKMNMYASKIEFLKSKKENVFIHKKGINVTQREFDSIVKESSKRFLSQKRR